ncbi:hypothetical protein V6N12_065805 [Hibiscus sabdariffa]|uniref:Uncharacterized protein n=1 Tax=Hibiscus sabdariffa TaxID=183260 RepID=A0ABR2GAT9_9ROSI
MSEKSKVVLFSFRYNKKCCVGSSFEHLTEIVESREDFVDEVWIDGKMVNSQDRKWSDDEEGVGSPTAGKLNRSNTYQVMRPKPKEIPKKSKDHLKTASLAEDCDSKDQESHVKVSSYGF